ncbi:MAG: hypothetical protein KAR20_23480 [Candidatus Heimdallarchaeota archaeon]|nr:hypothetical protein [Candidatus Heimdallarchaeota archaeon]
MAQQAKIYTDPLHTINIEEMLTNLYMMQTQIEIQIKQVKNMENRINEQLEIVATVSKNRSIKRDVEIYKEVQFQNKSY